MRARIILVALSVSIAFGCATTQQPAATAQMPTNESGIASWYGQEFAGRTTANGEIFDPLLMTAAHRKLPFGTLVDVKNPKTGQTVRVRINDRGPFIGNRLIDLSYAAAQQISLIDAGSGEIELHVVKLGNGEREPPAPYVVPVGGGKPSTQVASSEPPPVAFPLPTTQPAPVPQPVIAPPPMPSSAPNDFHVAVQEEHSGVTSDTKRVVSADGQHVDNVPVPSPAPVAADAPIVTETIAPAPVPQPSAGPVTHRTTKPATQRAQPPIPAPAPAASASDTEAAAPAPHHAAPASGGRYVVQVGAFSQEPNAKSLKDKLTKIGVDSYIDKTSLWRVRIGPFATREQAIKARENLESAGISAIIVAP